MTSKKAPPATQWQITKDIPLYGVKDDEQYARSASDWTTLGTISAGEVVEIAGETTTGGAQHGKQLATDGLWVPLRRVSDGSVWTVSFLDFNQNPTMLETPEVSLSYALRDTATGQWYAGNTASHTNGMHVTHGNYEDKVGKAKKFKRLADARGHMLLVSGYHEGLPDTDALPYWMRVSGKLDWPSTMEIVEIDKATKKELQTWETQEHLAKMWRLRDLTLNYGSSVRAMYKKLEDKEQLGNYPVMVVFRPQAQDRVHEYSMPPSEIYAIKSIAASMGKGTTLFIKDKANACLACSDEGVAWAATQFYNGPLVSHVLSLNTLVECVPTITSLETTRQDRTVDTLALPELGL